MSENLIVLNNDKIKRDFKIIEEKIVEISDVVSKIQAGSVIDEKQLKNSIEQLGKLERYFKKANKVSINYVLNKNYLLENNEDSKSIEKIKKFEPKEEDDDKVFTMDDVMHLYE